MSKKHYQEYMDRIGLDEARHQQILAALEKEEKERGEGTAPAPASKPSGRKSPLHWVIRISAAVAMLSLAYLAGSQHFFGGSSALKDNKKAEFSAAGAEITAGPETTVAAAATTSGNAVSVIMNNGQAYDRSDSEVSAPGDKKGAVTQDLSEESFQEEASQAEIPPQSYVLTGGEGFPIGVCDSVYEPGDNQLTIIWQRLAYILDLEQLNEEQLAQLKELLSFWGIELAE